MRFMTKHKKLIKILIAMLVILTVFNFLCPIANADKTEELEKTSNETFSLGKTIDGILGILLIGERAHISFIGKAMDLVMDSQDSRSSMEACHISVASPLK